jgi:anti-sigma B factor antagonist
MDKTIGAGKSKVVVNLTGVTFVDSTALSMLVQGMKRCREQHGDLILCGMQQRVRMIFELTRLDRAFEVVADEEGALHAFAA